MEFVNVSLPWLPERHAMIPRIVEKELRTEQVRVLFYIHIYFYFIFISTLYCQNDPFLDWDLKL